ncbi:hypothetical protein NE237_024813 [Protea cynaroides]|uniref:Uncharacterized protein n=1 Tax=Protea cynaroides TaxID=273540 RepID=A0A9Q0H4Y5_9MAGN|nr:hypothetical protein NE237_024813 [Protea cynaroides]
MHRILRRMHDKLLQAIFSAFYYNALWMQLKLLKLKLHLVQQPELSPRGPELKNFFYQRVKKNPKTLDSSAGHVANYAIHHILISRLHTDYSHNYCTCQPGSYSQQGELKFCS